MKFKNPASRYAIVGVFVADTAGGPRVAVTGAGPGVFRQADMEKALAAKFAARVGGERQAVEAAGSTPTSTRPPSTARTSSR